MTLAPTWRAPDVVCAGVFSVAYGALFYAWPAWPAQDAPAWIYEGALLGEVARGAAAHGCELTRALPPNALAQLAIAAVSGWLAPERAARLYVVLCTVLFAAGLTYLCHARARSGRRLASLACLPLCVGYPLFHGFLNYMAALPALCWGFGLVLRNPTGRGPRAVSTLVAWPTLLYLCHGTALGIWAVIVLLQVWVGRSIRFALSALLGFMPVAVLIGKYLSQRSSEGATIVWSAGSFAETALYRLRSPLRFFTVFHGLTPSFDDPVLRALAPVLVAINVGFALALTVRGLSWAVRARTSRDEQARVLAWAVLVLSVCALVLPHDVAKLLNPAERLLLPIACFAAAGLAGEPASSRSHGRLLSVALCALLAVQWLYVAVWGTQAAHASAALARLRARLGPRTELVQARQIQGALPAPPLGAAGLLTRHQVLLMQGTLAAANAGAAIPPFETGMFRCPATEGARVWDVAVLRQRGAPLVLLGESEHLRAVAAQLSPALTATEVGPGFLALQPPADR